MDDFFILVHGAKMMAKRKHETMILYLLVAWFLYLSQWDPALEPLRWGVAVMAAVLLIVEVQAWVRSAIR
jgi:hypothetical protein